MVKLFEKIAIVTLYDNINIGNKLQNYAMKKILENYSENVYTLTYSDAHDMAPDMGWKGKLVAYLGFPRSIALKKRAIIYRRKKFEDFSLKFLDAVAPLPFNQYNTSISCDYEAFVVGSDQVWHNWSNTREEIDYFFLSFVPIHKRVCVAPSFGLSRIPEQWIDAYSVGLDGFHHLSCRENDGCNIIRQIVDRECDLLLDPTLILDTKEWDSISTKPSFKLPEIYILVYIIGPISNESRNRIHEISLSFRAKVINIYDINDIEHYTTSPDEFVYLVKRAAAVCTNSFHGCAFSILYSKKVFLFNREDKEGSKMTGRINTLLNVFGLNPDNVEIDSHSVASRLDIERKHFYKYVEMCLSEVKENK